MNYDPNGHLASPPAPQQVLQHQEHHQQVNRSTPSHGMVNASQGNGGVIEPVDSDLESARNVFGERVKELSAAVAKVDALTRQLEELRKGNTSNSYHVASNGNNNSIKFNQEFEKLRQELLYRSRLVQNQSSDLESKKSLLNQKKSELVVIDEKIAQLQQRLAKKRHINQQLSYQMQSQAMTGPIGLNNQFNTLRGTSGHSYKRLPINQRSAVPNIAAVEPIQRKPQSRDQSEVNLKGGDDTLCVYSKHDPKYQTLPPNTKFNRNGLEITPDTVRGVIQGDLIRKDVRCGLDGEGFVGLRREDVSSSPSSTPTIDSAPEDGSLRILSSESGVGSSISSGCSFQSNSINLINGKDCSDPAKSVGREGELKARGAPITISLNSSSDITKSTSTPSTTTTLPQQLSSSSTTTTSENKKKGLSDHSLHHVPSSSSFPQQQNPINDSKGSKDHSVFTSNNNDWQKSRRRPVVVDDEDMERQLSALDCDAIELTQSHFPIERRKQQQHQQQKLTTTITSNSQKGVKPQEMGCIVKPVDAASSQTSGKCHEDVVEVESDSLSSAFSCDVTDDSSCSWNPVPRLEKVVVVEKTIEKSLNVKDSNQDQKVPTNEEKSDVDEVKRKSGLKNQKVSGLTRRVSFDPLALLLDAALEGELELVKKTALQVPDPSAVKDEGITALHNAICAGHFPIVRFLVEIACDVNAQDSDGWTPLHCAASCNNLAMIQLLVQNGACIFATTFSDHETAAEKCEEDEVGYDECYRYLSGVQEEMGIRNEGNVYAVYDYNAQNNDEMSFEDGDKVTIIRRGDDQEVDWWWARSERTGKEGYVPRNLFALFPRVKPKNLRNNNENH